MEKRLTTVAAAVSILATSLYLILTIQNEEILCFPYLEIVSKIQHNATLALLKKPSKKVIEHALKHVCYCRASYSPPRLLFQKKQ